MELVEELDSEYNFTVELLDTLYKAQMKDITEKYQKYKELAQTIFKRIEMLSGEDQWSSVLRDPVTGIEIIGADTRTHRDQLVRKILGRTTISS